MLNTNEAGVISADYLAGLVYELLDAHDDTVRLASGLTANPAWAAHLDYLKALQRVGREALAQLAAMPFP